MTGFLTTHILDTAKGCPAKNMKIELYRLEGTGRELIREMISNEDGRTNSPILPKEEFVTGTYELVFHAGDYLKASTQGLAEPLFLDVVPIRFGMSEQDHYHVPLLISPFGFSTYRGS